MTPEGKRNRTPPQTNEFAQDSKNFRESLAKVREEYKRDPTWLSRAETRTYVLDHVVQEFTIKIRSLTGVFPDQLKNLIEQSYEVVEISQTNSEAIGLPCYE